MIKTRYQWLAEGNTDTPNQVKIQPCKDRIIRNKEESSRLRITKQTRYAIDSYTGRLVHIDEVNLAEANLEVGRYKCASPTCRKNLIPCIQIEDRGQRAYFKHENNEKCVLPTDENGKIREGLLHIQTKLKIAQDGVSLPDISIYDIRNSFEPNIIKDGHSDIIIASHNLDLSYVKIEDRQDNRVPDITAKHANTNVIIEVCVTSPVTTDKLRDLINFNPGALIIEVYPKYTKEMDIDLSDVRVLYGGNKYTEIYQCLVRFLCKRIKDKDCTGNISGCYNQMQRKDISKEMSPKVVIPISGNTMGCCEKCKYFMGIDHSGYDCILCAVRLPGEDGVELPATAVELLSILRNHMRSII